MNADTRERAPLVAEETSAGEHESALADASATLLRAAELAASAGGDLDRFMAAAFNAYLQASPATRERVESAQLIAQLDELRRRGAVASA